MDRPIRIAHATDIHWSVNPPLGRMLLNKRMLGGINLLLGRGRHFDPVVQGALVTHIEALAPDAVLISGDLTALALEAEFELARAALDPVLQRFPTLVLAGNHDVYTRGAQRSRRIATWFADWMGLDADDPGGLARLDVGHVTLLGLDPNRPGLLSSGRLPPQQLQRLAEVLADGSLADRNLILALHYPILDRRGALYDGMNHGLRNAADLIAVLDAAPVRPIAIVHGHEHHGYRVDLPLTDGTTVPIFDPGSGGYAYLPDKRRAAAMNLYEVTAAGALRVERYRYDADGFQPEEGGAYATGR